MPKCLQCGAKLPIKQFFWLSKKNREVTCLVCQTIHVSVEKRNRWINGILGGIGGASGSVFIKLGTEYGYIQISVLYFIIFLFLFLLSFHWYKFTLKPDSNENSGD